MNDRKPSKHISHGLFGEKSNKGQCTHIQAEDEIKIIHWVWWYETLHVKRPLSSKTHIFEIRAMCSAKTLAASDR